MRFRIGILLILFFQFGFVWGANPNPVTLGQVPMHFEPNRGQADPDIVYIGQARAYTVLLAADSVRFLLHPSGKEVRIALEGQYLKPVIVGTNKTGATFNYYLGNDPAKWQTNVPTYAAITYKDVYPGIDWIFYEKDGFLEYDFIVAPGSDPSQIRMSVKGVNEIALDPRGELVAGPLRMMIPVVYQGQRKIPVQYLLSEDKTIQFRIASYDQRKPLVIDPKISFGTLIGGPTFDTASDVAIDNKGNMYVVGYSENGRGPGFGRALISKFNATGALLWSTFLGGSGGDSAEGVAVTPGGIVYVAGSTFSRDFPVVGAFQSKYAGAGDVFISKISTTGGLVRSSYHGGSGLDSPVGIKLGPGPKYLNEVYLFGNTQSRNFPRVTPVQNQFRPPVDGYLTVVHAINFTRVFSSYIGKNGKDEITSLGFNKSRGDVYIGALNPGATGGGYIAHLKPVAGDVTASKTKTERDLFFEDVGRLIPAFGAFRRLLKSCEVQDGEFIQIGGVSTKGPNTFVVLAGDSCLPQPPATTCNDGQVLLLFDQDLNFRSGLNMGAPGSGFLFINEMVVRSNKLYLTGETVSKSLPNVNAFQATNKGGWEGFVMTMVPSASGTFQTVFSSYLGGSGFDFARGLSVDARGNMIVVGQTSSQKFPTTPNAIKRSLGGTADAFLVKIAP